MSLVVGFELVVQSSCRLNIDVSRLWKFREAVSAYCCRCANRTELHIVYNNKLLWRQN
jgi:hypothetical protein